MGQMTLSGVAPRRSLLSSEAIDRQGITITRYAHPRSAVFQRAWDKSPPCTSCEYWSGRRTSASSRPAGRSLRFERRIADEEQHSRNAGRRTRTDQPDPLTDRLHPTNAARRPSALHGRSGLRRNRRYWCARTRLPRHLPAQAAHLLGEFRRASHWLVFFAPAGVPARRQRLARAPERRLHCPARGVGGPRVEARLPRLADDHLASEAATDPGRALRCRLHGHATGGLEVVLLAQGYWRAT